MASAGITSRTQATPTTDSITDNVLVVSGLEDLNQSRENRLVSNTKIFVGANVTDFSSYTSHGTRPSAIQADPCLSSRNAKIPEEPLSEAGDEPIAPPHVSGQCCDEMHWNVTGVGYQSLKIPRPLSSCWRKSGRGHRGRR